MNLHHSEGIGGILEANGYRIVDRLDDADIVVLNTCMVRQKAEEKALGRLGAIASEKARRDLLIGVGGCMPQVRGAPLLERLPAVDFLFGSTDFRALPELIASAVAGRRPCHLPRPEGLASMPFRRAPGVRAMVTITEGCSSWCSYCVVPRARGPLRSRPPEDVLREVEAALGEGFAEILLLGQNVDSYGTDRREFGSFAQLLREVASRGPRRVRFTTSHPRDVTSELIEALADVDAVCNHIHLACQSGSDRILEAMNRGYTRTQFLDVVRRLRASVPGINITTDLIVGFPGETADDFARTFSLVEEAQFGAAYVAMYSPRPGTRSAAMKDDVPSDVKERRLHVVLERQREIAREQNERRIGETVEVLVEGASRHGGSFGRTADHRTAVVDARVAAGTMIPVRIEHASASALHGVCTAPVSVEA
ncbi:MAG: tRNA (N6-isopentenyl adenosine(37)-C2)-methylthiotransferase MiaB [Candidatus Bipolaricaulota bacterium]|nr:MAG: tRNA (N6-isopentenyl adenosine(37)-C2)-methylthiotransferase MiaB [Candidatus Bipolaricaulota bacterium]